jgi:hypothetical protein
MAAVCFARSAGSELIANDQGVVTSRPVRQEGPPPSMTRTVTFGDRDWSLGYYAKTNSALRGSFSTTENSERSSFASISGANS